MNEFLDARRMFDDDGVAEGERGKANGAFRKAFDHDDGSLDGMFADVRTPRVSETANAVTNLVSVRSFGSESSMYGGVADAGAGETMADAAPTQRDFHSDADGGEDDDKIAGDDSLRRSARVKSVSTRLSKDPFTKAGSRLRGLRLKNLGAAYADIRVVSLGALAVEDVDACAVALSTERRNANPTLFIPREYEVNGTLFDEPFSGRVDAHGVHHVTWGHEGEGRQVVNADAGAMTAEEACKCIMLEITRRYNEGIPSAPPPARANGAQGTICGNPNCGIASTPLMRRGPNGMRTLCNACGLWYARRGTMRPCGRSSGATQDIGTPPAPVTELQIFIREPPTKEFNALNAFGYFSDSIQNALRTACKAARGASEKTKRAKLDAFNAGMQLVFDRPGVVTSMLNSVEDLETFVSGIDPASSKMLPKNKRKNASDDATATFLANQELSSFWSTNIIDDLHLPWYSKGVGDPETLTQFDDDDIVDMQLFELNATQFQRTDPYTQMW